MIKTTFYCDIYSDSTGEVIQSDFDFDCGEFETAEDLERYKANCGYVIGEPCGYWGDDVGILTDILTEE